MRKVTTVLGVAMLCVTVLAVQALGADRPTVRNPVSFKLASTKAVQGFDKVTVDRTNTLYMTPKAVLSGTDVTFAETVDGRAVDLALADGAAKRLAGLASKHGADRLAIFMGGRLVGTGVLKVDASGGRAVLSGLAAKQADHLIRVLNGQALAGPTVTVVQYQSTVQAGGTITVDLFLSGAQDVRTYQATLAIQGGTQGQLTVEDLTVSDSRSDYVFGTAQKINAEDRVTGRLGATLISGGLNVTTGYLGSFTLRASADAAGSFDVNVRLDRSSFLRDSKNTAIGFFAGPAATIDVGAPSRVKPSGK